MDEWIGEGEFVLARFVPHATPSGLILTTREDVADQAVPAEEAVHGVRERVVSMVGRRPWPVEGGLDQGPATSDPVTVAAINEFVGATRETALWGMLAGRQPRDKQWNIKVALAIGDGVSMQCFHVASSVDGIVEREGLTAGWLDVENR